MARGALAAAMYYARRRNREARPIAVTMQPRGLSVSHTISVAADVLVAQAANIMDHGDGVSTLSLSGADAASFSLTGRKLFLKSGTTLTAGTPLAVSVDVSNDVRGDASALFTLTVT